MNFSVVSGVRSPFVVAAFLMLALFQPGIASAQNSAPQISGTPPTTVSVGQRYYFRPTASDADGDVLKFAISRKPFWMTFDTTTGTLSGVPTTRQVGVYRDIKITVSDRSQIRALPRFSFTVTALTNAGATNRAPVISGTPVTTVTVGQAYLFQPTASDADGNTLTFTVQNRPAWATFNTATGRLSGTPGVANVGSYSNITIGVSDGATTSRLAPFSITVQAAALNNVATIRWTAPTTNTDGSPLVDLAEFRVSYGQTSRSYSHVLSTGSPSVTSLEIQGLTAGTWYFAVKAVNSRGVESTLSTERSKTF
jgi:hypothetical protein